MIAKPTLCRELEWASAGGTELLQQVGCNPGVSEKVERKLQKSLMLCTFPLPVEERKRSFPVSLPPIHYSIDLRNCTSLYISRVAFHTHYITPKIQKDLFCYKELGGLPPGGES